MPTRIGGKMQDTYQFVDIPVPIDGATFRSLGDSGLDRVMPVQMALFLLASLFGCGESASTGVTAVWPSFIELADEVWSGSVLVSQFH